ncbi:hypothetical protein NSK_001423 [Nannochloropsis salina CCMP1776]|uniref:Vesicle tethering protein Uso1/P115-like head domain-containing protein n=1 Tax=Nannochloropsis salina CCMP1776 TaxID=1027361 RepID=A0A4D9DEK4_9STRA|nr:hypothetical protein NSK_001423 [Nannochloropsis salina CCMP1776]|eukprot:TFJ87089.1 hypothetical protein NSK_001423 [Nannochloropsis salina CCMP1776]
MMLAGARGTPPVPGKSTPSSPTADHAVAVILDRLRSARDPKDRADAVEQLQSLGKTDPSRVGRLAMPLVLDLLRARRLGQLDEGTAQGLLELLRALLSHAAPGVGREVLSLLLKNTGNLDALLDMAEKTDTLTTVATLQVLEAALEAGQGEVECALQGGGSQQGMVRLVACLSDEREEVRNEVLLVLGKLTTGRATENLKTLLAFNEGFERLLAMIEDDGGLLEGGSVITHDCLRLMGNVVAGTASTQRHFCELGPLETLAPWMDVTRVLAVGEEEEEEEEGAQADRAPRLEARQMESLRLALVILRNLVTSTSSPGLDDSETDGQERQRQDRRDRQRSLMTCAGGGLLRSLVQLATAPFQGEGISKVQLPSLVLLADMVTDNTMVQQTLLDLKLGPSCPYLWPEGGPDQIIGRLDREHGGAFLASVLLKMALHARHAHVRAAALLVLHRLLDKNEVACIMTMQHIIAPPPPPVDLAEEEEWVPSVPMGTVLLEELVRAVTQALAGGEDEEERGRAQSACFVLEHVLAQGGRAARELATHIPADLGGMGGGGGGGGGRASPAAADSKAREPASARASGLSFSPSPHIKALSALLVGECVEYAGEGTDESRGPTGEEVEDMIKGQVGLSLYTAALEGLEKVLVPGKNFVGEWPTVDGERPGGPWPYYDSQFVSLYRREVKRIRRRLLLASGEGLEAGVGIGDGGEEDRGAAIAAAAASAAEKYLEVIAEREKEIECLKVRIEDVQSQMQEFARGQASGLSGMESFQAGEGLSRPGGRGGNIGREVFQEEQQRREAAEMALRGKEAVVESLQEELRRRDSRLASLQSELTQVTEALSASMQKEQELQHQLPPQQKSQSLDQSKEAEEALLATNLELRRELSAAHEELAARGDDRRKLELELQRANAREKTAVEEGADAVGRLDAVEKELSAVSTGYQELQQELERAHRAVHTENQRLKRAEEEKERLHEELGRMEQQHSEEKHRLEEQLRDLGTSSKKHDQSVSAGAITEAVSAAVAEAGARHKSVVEKLERELQDTQILAGEIPEYRRALEEYRVYSEAIQSQVDEMRAYAEGQAQLVAELQQQQQQQLQQQPHDYAHIQQYQNQLNGDPSILSDGANIYETAQPPDQYQQEQRQVEEDHGAEGQKPLQQWQLPQAYASQPSMPSQHTEDPSQPPAPPAQDASSLFPVHEGGDSASLFPDHVDAGTPSLFPPAPQPHQDARGPTPDASCLFEDPHLRNGVAAPPPPPPYPHSEPLGHPSSSLPAPATPAVPFSESLPGQAQAEQSGGVEELQERLVWMEAQVQEARAQAAEAIGELDRLRAWHAEEMERLAGLSETTSVERERTLNEQHQERRRAEETEAALRAEAEDLRRSAAHAQEQEIEIRRTLQSKEIELEALHKELAAATSFTAPLPPAAQSSEVDEDVAITATLQGAEKDLAEVRQQLDEVIKREEALHTETSDLRMKLEAAQRTHAAAEEEYHRQVEELRFQLQQAQHLASESAGSLEAKDGHLGALARQLEEKEGEKMALGLENERLNSEIVHLEGQISGLMGREKEQVAHLEGEVDRLTKALQESIDAERRVQNEHVQVLREKEEEKTALKRDVDASEAAQQQAVVDAQKAKEQLIDAERRIAVLEAQIVTNKERIKEQEGVINHLNMELQAATAAVEALDSAAAKAAAEAKTKAEAEDASKRKERDDTQEKRDLTKDELLAILAEREEEARQFDEDRANITSEFQALVTEKRKEADALLVERHELLQKLLYAEEILKQQTRTLHGVREERERTQHEKDACMAEFAEMRRKYDALAARRAETAELLDELANKEETTRELRESVLALESQLEAASLGWKGVVQAKEGEVENLQAAVELSKAEESHLREEFTQAQGTILSLLDAVAVASPGTRQRDAYQDDGTGADVPEPSVQQDGDRREEEGGSERQTQSADVSRCQTEELLALRAREKQWLDYQERQEEYVAQFQGQIHALKEELSRSQAEKTALDASNPRTDCSELQDLKGEVANLTRLVAQQEEEAKGSAAIAQESETLRSLVDKLQNDLRYYQDTEALQQRTVFTEVESILTSLVARLEVGLPSPPPPPRLSPRSRDEDPTGSRLVERLRWYVDIATSQLGEIQAALEAEKKERDILNEQVQSSAAIAQESETLRSLVDKLQNDLRYYQDTEALQQRTVFTEVESILTSLVARLEVGLPSPPPPPRLSPRSRDEDPTGSRLVERLRWYVDIATSQLGGIQAALEAEKKERDILNEQIQNYRKEISHLSETQIKKDEEICSAHTELDELRVLMARRAEEGAMLPETGMGRLSTASSGTTANANGETLLLQGTAMELKALRKDYDALRQTHAVVQEEAAARVERLTDMLDAKEQMVATISREHNRLKNEMDFEVKLKAGMLEDRDRKLDSLSRQAMQQRRALQHQVEKLESRMRATEEERDVLAQRLEELVERHGTAIRARDKAMAKLKEEHDKQLAPRGPGFGVGYRAGELTEHASKEARWREREAALARAQDQLETLKHERDRLRKELQEARKGHAEALKGARRELAAALESNSALQLELNGRDIQHQSTRRDYLALEVELSKNTGVALLQRETENQLRDRDSRIQSLEKELTTITTERDQLRSKLEEKWNRVMGRGRNRRHLKMEQRSSSDGRSRGQDADGDTVSVGGSSTFGFPQGALIPCPVRSPMAQAPNDQALEEDLQFLQTKLLQLRQDLCEERALFKQLENEHEELLEIMGETATVDHGRQEHGQDGLGGGPKHHDEYDQGQGEGHAYSQSFDEEVEQYYYQHQPDLV